MKRAAAVIVALLLSGCGSAPPRPPVVTPTPPVVPMGYLAVWITDGARPLAGATVHADGLDLPARTNADGWSGVAAPHGSYTVRITAPGFKPSERPIAVGGHTDLRVALVPVAPPALPVRVDGRFWITDVGTFRPRFQSALSLLVRGPPERAAFLDQTVALGFNGIRVFAGHLGWAGQEPDAARAALPALLGEAASRGLTVYVCALTGGGYDVENHLADVAAIVARYPNAILEVANEIGHPTQSDLGKDPARLLEVARRVIPPGVTWTLGAPVGTDEPTPDGRYEADGGLFNDAHLDRSRDLYNQVRRLREIYAISENTRKPAMSGEPIGIAEVPMPGRQRLWGDDALRFSYAYGVLCRGFELGCVFHSEQGLHGQVLGPNTVAAAEAFVAGTRAILSIDRLQFVNAGWAGSPVRAADFDRGIVRAYSFVSGNRGWTVLVGLRGDPRVEWGGGWYPVRVVAERPGVQVIEIAR